MKKKTFIVTNGLDNLSMQREFLGHIDKSLAKSQEVEYETVA
jgi:hypothetical protein